MIIAVDKQIIFTAEEMKEKPDANNPNLSWLSFCVFVVKKLMRVMVSYDR